MARTRDNPWPRLPRVPPQVERSTSHEGAPKNKPHGKSASGEEVRNRLRRQLDIYKGINHESPKDRLAIHASIFKTYSASQLRKFPFAAGKDDYFRRELVAHLAEAEATRTFFGFEALPDELQLQIIELAVPKGNSCDCPDKQPAISRVNRKLRDMALPIFYKRVTVTLGFHTSRSSACSRGDRCVTYSTKLFLKNISLDTLRHIQNLNIVLWEKWTDPIEFEIRISHKQLRDDRALRRTKCGRNKEVEVGSPYSKALDNIRRTILAIADRPRQEKGLRFSDINDLVFRLWCANARSLLRNHKERQKRDTVRYTVDSCVISDTQLEDEERWLSGICSSSETGKAVLLQRPGIQGGKMRIFSI